MFSKDDITLHIGGAKFKSTRSTLTKYPNLFKAILERDNPPIVRTKKYRCCQVAKRQDCSKGIAAAIVSAAEAYDADSEYEEDDPCTSSPDREPAAAYNLVTLKDVAFNFDEETGTIFVDRSPKHFELVLNYLRDGQTPIPACSFDRAQLLLEAQFYKVDGLIFLCGGDPSKKWKTETFHNECVHTNIMDDFYEFEENHKKFAAVTIHYNSARLGDISKEICTLDFISRHGGKYKILFCDRDTAAEFLHWNMPDVERWKFFSIGTARSIKSMFAKFEEFMV